VHAGAPDPGAGQPGAETPDRERTPAHGVPEGLRLEGGVLEELAADRVGELVVHRLIGCDARIASPEADDGEAFAGELVGQDPGHPSHSHAHRVDLGVPDHAWPTIGCGFTS
jgi:hypothetical protein